MRDGYLPILRSWWQDGAIHWEQIAVLDSLDSDLGDIRLDDPTVLLVRLRAVNTSKTESATASLTFSSLPAGGREDLTLERQHVFAVEGDQRRLRFLVNDHGQGASTASTGDIGWSLDLAPGDSHTLHFAIPSITLPGNHEFRGLSEQGFDDACRRVGRFWRELTDQGTRISTPESQLNDFYKAHLRHLMVNCWKEIDSDRLHAHVGTLKYGVYPNESAMMISDLDRRGYHEVAERNLQSYLDYQGTAALPGGFSSREGVFYGAAGHEEAGYNKSHGYVLWLMAEHWWLTRDREWMERAAPKLILGCEWVIRERQATMKNRSDGSRPIEFGFLPAGSLEDVTDFWYWLATNTATAWGFEALANAFTDFGHPRGPELQREAAAYRNDVLAALRESRIRSPVVRLRDNTYVPKFPSRLNARGRSRGWIREVLEGSLFIATQLADHIEPYESTWILKDYEDNLYPGGAYGYTIPAFDRFWFSRGGFSMQANLLDGPIPYLYRDEIKHYLRAYFNALASAYYPDIRMCNEHSMPELGYPRGDHFKSSDEAQSTYWLRLMFVHERHADLFLGQAIPRYWLADGQTISIERAPSHFGPLSLRIESNVNTGSIRALVQPPTRNPPENTYLRLRHPEAKPITRVTINGQDHEQFDAEKEWIVLPTNAGGQLDVTAHYSEDQ